jgi:hypothetical protein
MKETGEGQKKQQAIGEKFQEETVLYMASAGWPAQ